MAGASVAGVGDATAALVNPAGLMLIRDAEVFLSLGVAGATRQAGVTPEGPWRSSASVPLVGSVGAGLKLADWLAVGVASATLLRETTHLPEAAGRREDLQLGLVEFGPQVAFSLPTEDVVGPIRLGVGYQAVLGGVGYQRETQGMQSLDYSSGMGDAGGFRLGVQATPLPELSLGVSVTTPRGVEGSAEEATIGGAPTGPSSASLYLPFSIDVGARFDLDRVGLAVEYGYRDSSELQLRVLAHTNAGTLEESLFEDLRDRSLLRVGVEYRLPLRRGELPLRLGYRMQTAAGTSRAPSPVGPLPARFHAATMGAGVRLRQLEWNLAFEVGTGAAGASATACSSCGPAGDYALHYWGVQLDTSYRFRL